MDQKSVEGYTDKMFYFKGDKVSFFLRSDFDSNKALITKISAPYNYLPVDSFYFGIIQQELNDNQSENGCGWNTSYNLNLDQKYSDGYYKVIMISKADTFNLTFTVGSKNQNPKVIVVAPVTTFTAYNPWGGKSLYHNVIDSTNTLFVSTQRPNTCIQYFQNSYNHVDANVCANISNWFINNYDAVLLPDYMLQQNPGLFDSADIIVLSYHCEYFSSEMYDELEKLVFEKNKSLISIGGNQIYWKIRWHDDFTKIECRKDLTSFDEPFGIGGMWRHNLRSESGLLGVRYTGTGLNSFAPYKILNPGHWLYNEINVSEGELFGLKGINNFPICGDEMDKVPFWMEYKVDVIAKGLNCKTPDGIENYKPDDPKWNGDGGGDMTFRELDGNAVLSTGSIYSGSGLGSDSVFTTVIKNFTEKYLR